MRRAAIILHLLAVAFTLASVDAHSQARGPSHAQTQKEGRHISGSQQLREAALQQALAEAEQERIALLDPAERARRFAELDAILRRLPGRFRIEGRIQLGVAGTGPGGDVRGVADCSAVGRSAGLNCIINASWPIIEPLRGGRPVGPPPASERLGTMRPAVLVIGLNVDPPGLRAMMVTADTLAFSWVGQLEGHGVNLTRPSRCWGDVRCYQTFELTADPDSGATSFVLKAGAYTIDIAMHPDSDAVPSNALKPLKAR